MQPDGRCIGAARRQALVDAAARIGLPMVEVNPYGDLWFDAPPPRPLAARWPEGVLYLGSFSKVLTPGFRLGYLVAPPALYPKLLQAKQAADLHTPGFNQRMVAEVMKDGFLDRHVPTIRARYKRQRDAMSAALDRHMPAGTTWQVPVGGMFFWVTVPAGPHLVPRRVLQEPRSGGSSGCARSRAPVRPSPPAGRRPGWHSEAQRPRLRPRRRAR